MKLVFINGSPRGKSSNTKILLDHFLAGYRSVDMARDFKEYYLRNQHDLEKSVQALQEADMAILAFPLYTDAMPGIVKEFIEAIDPVQFGNEKLKLGFIVQSGFPEAVHSRPIQRYLEKWCSRLGATCLGTMIRGGVEGLRIQPGWMTRYTEYFYEQGQFLALEGRFSMELIRKLGKPDRLRGFRLYVYKMLQAAGLSNFYWNKQLKENKAYHNRFAKPYIT